MSTSAGRRPNILWIQTDEQRIDSLGCYGSEWARTPHVDALARRGVLFTHCFCASPVCVPSRASQLAARFPQELNVTMNTGGPFPAGTVTFPEVFAAAGYVTASYGKSHTPAHSTWSDSEDIRHFEQYAGNWSLGVGYDDARYRLVRDQGNDGLILGGTYPGGVDTPSRTITDGAIRFLRKRQPDNPFLLRVSHLWPHTPVLVPPPFDGLYTAAEVPVRPFDPDAYSARSHRDRAWADRSLVRELDPAAFAQTWVDYMALCAYIDGETGRLLATLDDLGLSEDTIVLFSSDHGRLLGEWGAIGKATFDDVVWRVPLVICWPVRLPAGEQRADLCTLLDTARTLTGLAGLSASEPQQWRGRDLFASPAQPAGEPHHVFGQIGFPNRAAAPAIARRKAKAYDVDVIGPALRLAVRTRSYRMDVAWMQDGVVLDPTERDGNLFDLQQDPHEIENLYSRPDAQPVVRELTAELDAHFAGLERPNALFDDATGPT